jgi:hypothetical protein
MGLLPLEANHGPIKHFATNRITAFMVFRKPAYQQTGLLMPHFELAGFPKTGEPAFGILVF